MESQSLSPKESLDLITEVLRKAKERQEESGVVYIFWGLLVAGVNVCHFVLQEMNQYAWIFIPYLLIPVGIVVTYYAFPHYRERSKNYLGKAIGVLWIFAGANKMILGFVLAMDLGNHLAPYIMILLGISLGVSGFILQFRILLSAGILANLAGLATFWIPWEFHPLIMTSNSILTEN